MSDVRLILTEREIFLLQNILGKKLGDTIVPGGPGGLRDQLSDVMHKLQVASVMAKHENYDSPGARLLRDVTKDMPIVWSPDRGWHDDDEGAAE